MQQTQPQSEPFKAPATLKEFNACLEALGLQRLSKDTFQQLLQQEGRERLVNALRRARTDSGAQAYLHKVVAAVLPDPPAAGEPPAPPPAATVTPLPQRLAGQAKADPDSQPEGEGGSGAGRLSIHKCPASFCSRPVFREDPFHPGRHRALWRKIRQSGL